MRGIDGSCVKDIHPAPIAVRRRFAFTGYTSYWVIQMNNDSTSESSENDESGTRPGDTADIAGAEELAGREEPKKTLTERVIRKIRKVDGDEKPNIYPLF